MVSLGDTAVSLHIPQLNSKCQDLLEFQFSGGGGQVFCPSQNLKCQDLPKFQFPGEGVFCPSQNSKCQDLANFSFRGGGGGGVFCPRTGCSRQFEQKICLVMPLSGNLCITNSLSHTTYVETNKVSVCWLQS